MTLRKYLFESFKKEGLSDAEIKDMEEDCIRSYPHLAHKMDVELSESEEENLRIEFNESISDPKLAEEVLKEYEARERRRALKN